MCEMKGADKLYCNGTTGHHICFRYIIWPTLYFKPLSISSHWLMSLLVRNTVDRFSQLKPYSCAQFAHISHQGCIFCHVNGLLIICTRLQLCSYFLDNAYYICTYENKMKNPYPCLIPQFNCIKACVFLFLMNLYKYITCKHDVRLSFQYSINIRCFILLKTYITYIVDVRETGVSWFGQGCHSISISNFPDFSLTFPWLSTVFQALLEGQF